jgi:CRISPR-associated protein Csd1
VPRHLIEACQQRASQRAGRARWEWEKCLGIACGLFRGNRWEERYSMSLEDSRTTRDYLFGRLLAVAEHIEIRALHVADENRETNAAKLMQRFAEQPCSTWRTLSLALMPYLSRLRANRAALALRLERQLDGVMIRFDTTDFVSDAKLSGEFLLGYHCQRAALWEKNETNETAAAEPAAAV